MCQICTQLVLTGAEQEINRYYAIGNMLNLTPNLEGSLQPIERINTGNQNERIRKSTAVQQWQALACPNPFEELPGVYIGNIQQRQESR